MTKIAIENIEPMFLIFSVTIFVTQFPPIATIGPSDSGYCVLGVTKIAAEKIKDYEVGRLFFFYIYQHLAKPDDKVDRPYSKG